MNWTIEEEIWNDLEKDDAKILEERYHKETSSCTSPILKPDVEEEIVVGKTKKIKRGSNPSHMPGNRRSSSYWTRCHDAIQEHFNSHVTIDGLEHRLPNTICALKLSAKKNWVLYKKRECERRKRMRKRIELEKTKETNGEPANILLSMVDSCENCKKLYVTVNLFWGVTLCDLCYFNISVINEIMTQRFNLAENQRRIHNGNIVSQLLLEKQEEIRSSVTTTTTFIGDSSVVCMKPTEITHQIMTNDMCVDKNHTKNDLFYFSVQPDISHVIGATHFQRPHDEPQQNIKNQSNNTVSEHPNSIFHNPMKENEEAILEKTRQIEEGMEEQFFSFLSDSNSNPGFESDSNWYSPLSYENMTPFSPNPQ